MKMGFSRQVAIALGAACIGFSAPGCTGRGPETSYGLSRGTSLNGTSVFAAMLADRGHEVQAAVRLNDELGNWANGIIRFAPYPGPPDKDEGQWFTSWLSRDRNRWLIYVVHDFDTAAEYWRQIRDGISDSAEPDRRAQAEEQRKAAADWVNELPPKATDAALSTAWFTIGEPWSPPRVCTRLSGEWATGIDAAAAALTVHEPLKADEKCILLEGDGKPLVIDKSRVGQPRVLVIANGSFLLNEALVNAARRPLAQRVADWSERDRDHVAFVEGGFTLGDDRQPTLWDLLGRVAALRWVAFQVGLAGLAAALARAPRLGRPRPEGVSGADRPAAHAEAMGALLEKTRAAGEARELVERYRQWRGAQASREPARSSGRARAPARAAAARPAGPAPAAQPGKPAD